jgi:hypothetical protein
VCRLPYTPSVINRWMDGGRSRPSTNGGPRGRPSGNKRRMDGGMVRRSIVAECDTHLSEPSIRSRIMYHVIVHQRLVASDANGWLERKLELPFPPFAGLTLRRGGDNGSHRRPVTSWPVPETPSEPKRCSASHRWQRKQT